jgi:hypothetical protein
MDVLQREMPMVMSSRANGDVGAVASRRFPPTCRPAGPWRRRLRRTGDNPGIQPELVTRPDIPTSANGRTRAKEVAP